MVEIDTTFTRQMSQDNVPSWCKLTVWSSFYNELVKLLGIPMSNVGFWHCTKFYFIQELIQF